MRDKYRFEWITLAPTEVACVHSLTVVEKREMDKSDFIVVRRSPFVVHRKVLQGGFHPLYIPCAIR